MLMKIPHTDVSGKENPAMVVGWLCLPRAGKMWYSPSEYPPLALVSVRNNQTDGAQILLTKIFSKLALENHISYV